MKNKTVNPTVVINIWDKQKKKRYWGISYLIDVLSEYVSFFTMKSTFSWTKMGKLSTGEMYINQYAKRVANNETLEKKKNKKKTLNSF